MFHIPVIPILKTILFYIITPVILAFLLVLAYDLIEDRCTIDLIITKSFPLLFESSVKGNTFDDLIWFKDC